MIGMHSVNSQRPWILLAVLVGAGAALTGLVMASDAKVDVPANELGFYVHRFEYDPPEGARPKSIAVGGGFNNWSENGFPMKPDGAGHFVADVKLAEGPHSYPFFVVGD